MQGGFGCIVDILKGKNTTLNGSKHTKYSLKMTELFILIDSLLYSKDSENGHK